VTGPKLELVHPLVSKKSGDARGMILVGLDAPLSPLTNDGKHDNDRPVRTIEIYGHDGQSHKK